MKIKEKETHQLLDTLAAVTWIPARTPPQRPWLCSVQVKAADDCLSKASGASQTPALCQIPTGALLRSATSAPPDDTWTPLVIPQWKIAHVAKFTSAGMSPVSAVHRDSLVSHVDAEQMEQPTQVRRQLALARRVNVPEERSQQVLESN